jgi:drug/metabolite transporter (DMT)-like permease
MEMLAGGALLLVCGSVVGEWGQSHPQTVSLRSALSLGYLIAAGSLVGFTAYIWLLRAAPSSVVSTYAYVNPVVAVFLGWALAGEAVTARTLLAAGVIIAGVVVITTYRAHAQGEVREGVASAQASEVASASTRGRA